MATSTYLTVTCWALPVGQQPDQQNNSPGSVVRRIGTVKSINGPEITLTPDSGPEISVNVQSNTRILRTAPGAKDLKSATPIQLQDLQIGDRILVGGKLGDNGSIQASAVVVMKLSDVEAKHQQDLQAWQTGVSGLVCSVDPSAGTVTISTACFPAKKEVVIRTTSATTVRRYPPNSVKFDDAKPSQLSEIRPADAHYSGDQVRARGKRAGDGSDFTAEEVVSGAFRDIEGTVNSVDASSSTVSVQDLLSKEPVTVKITQDSQLHQLPPEMAQRIAMRLKRAAGGETPGPGNAPTGQSPAGAPSPAAMSPQGDNGGSRRPSGAPDLQQILNRLPRLSVNDLHKGDAVMVLSTEASAGTGIVVMLVTGVEPILRAAPSASAASILTPWSLSAPAGDMGGP